MKYIRTKDNHIFKLSNGTDFEKTKETYVWCFDKRLGFHFKVDIKIILKQANTIEELVDEYVRVHKTTNVKPMICDKELAISSSKYPSCYDVYGSIWVGADLLSKAKMNDKGELELL